MLDFLTLSRKAGIGPERDVIKYIRSAIAADGLITRFAPSFSVGHHLEKCVSSGSRVKRGGHVQLRHPDGVGGVGGRLMDNGPARARQCCVASLKAARSAAST